MSRKASKVLVWVAWAALTLQGCSDQSGPVP